MEEKKGFNVKFDSTPKERLAFFVKKGLKDIESNSVTKVIDMSYGMRVQGKAIMKSDGFAKYLDNIYSVADPKKENPYSYAAAVIYFCKACDLPYKVFLCTSLDKSDEKFEEKKEQFTKDGSLFDAYVEVDGKIYEYGWNTNEFEHLNVKEVDVNEFGADKE